MENIEIERVFCADIGSIDGGQTVMIFSHSATDAVQQASQIADAIDGANIVVQVKERGRVVYDWLHGYVVKPDLEEYNECQSAVFEHFFPETNDHGLAQQKTDLWFESPNPMFGGLSPATMLVARPSKALKIIMSLVDDNG